ncbi:MAG TPA: pyridine nucleotide-disulfide oxidoreductase, partial [Leucothrix mucor]|nr:pyridine nucleotide-disulfide oxidoreductase [Leucothrix mucor]
TTFTHAFNVTYANNLQYHPNVILEAVDSNRRIAITSSGDFKADVLNVIPTQSAGKIIKSAGLANHASGRWADVDPISYESTSLSNIHIIGDSQGTGQPKAGHIANAEAKVCADAIIRMLGGAQPYHAPMTNSACYSPISTTTASWATVVYQYNPATQSMTAVPGSSGAASVASNRSYRDMFDWSENLFTDTFA